MKELIGSTRSYLYRIKRACFSFLRQILIQLSLTDKVATKADIDIHIHIHINKGNKKAIRTERARKVDRQKESTCIPIQSILVQRTMNDGNVMPLRLFNTHHSFHFND